MERLRPGDSYNLAMQFLRRCHPFARMLLAWWALTLGVAAASPLVVLPSVERLCSGAGTMHYLWAGDPVPQQAGHALDCPLCVPVAAPGPATVAAAQVEPIHACQRCIRARVPHTARTAAPLQARGPPDHLL